MQRTYLLGHGIHDRWRFDVISLHQTNPWGTRSTILRRWNRVGLGLFASSWCHSSVNRSIRCGLTIKRLCSTVAIWNRTTFWFQPQDTSNWRISVYRRFVIDEVRRTRQSEFDAEWLLQNSLWPISLVHHPCAKFGHFVHQAKLFRSLPILVLYGEQVVGWISAFHIGSCF